MDMFPKEICLIDKDSPIPAYQQIATDLIRRISQEEWVVGGRIEPENVLAEYYGVSRVTLRQALAMLERDGIIDKQQGRGVFVAANPKVFVQDLRFPSLETIGKKRKNTITSRNIIIQPEAKADRRVFRKLCLQEEAEIIYLQRLFFREDVVIGMNRVWFPAHLVEGLVEQGLVDSSISKTLEQRYHHTVDRIENYIESTKLDVATASLLNSVYDASALKIQSIHYLSDKTPVEFSDTIWLGDCTRFSFVVSR